jgi:A/G-specific adenine glycosylase
MPSREKQEKNRFEHRLARRLLEWYRKKRTLYPWRLTSDPYLIWLSEILLQQTRIPIVLQYFEKIVNRYPTLKHLIDADPSEFVSHWSGIGYYRRAQNMLLCAQYLSKHYSGQFPRSPELLAKLPGIGKYTAGAISNICFGKLTPALDGNITRVLARLTNNKHARDSQAFRRNLEFAYVHFGKNASSGDYFQALMELGERICLPQPNCFACPVLNFCEAARKNQTHLVPSRKPKRSTINYNWYLLALRKDQHHFFVQNSSREFLREAWLFPDILSRRTLSMKRLNAEFKTRWLIDPGLLQKVGSLSHSITFRKVQCHVVSSQDFQIDKLEGKWLTSEELKVHPTSSIMHKVFGRLFTDLTS